MSDQERRQCVLVPITNSDASRQILPAIQRFLDPATTQLILLHVSRAPHTLGTPGLEGIPGRKLDQGDAPNPPPQPIYASQQEESILSEVTTSLLPLVRRLESVGFEVGVRVAFGVHVVDQIVRLATQGEIEMIAMSTHARVGVSRFFFGDVARDVLQRVHVPMLLIRPDLTPE